MHLIYVDDSGDEKLRIFSALAIPADSWHETEARVRSFRQALQKSDGIYLYKEFHAWEFVSGRGQIADRILFRSRRCEIFKEALQLTATLPGAHLFNVVYPAASDEQAFEALLGAIDQTMQIWDSHAVLICDEGKELTYTRLARKLNTYDPTNSDGEGIALAAPKRIIEDPFFRNSRQSYLIQLSDFCAYALLRRERPLPSKSKYGLDQAFALLRSCLVYEANRGDPEGIIRP